MEKARGKETKILPQRKNPAVSYVSLRVSTQFPACDTVSSFFLLFLH